MMPDIPGVDPGHAAAGFGGALASLPFMEKKEWLTLTMAVISGLMASVYMTPWFAETLASPKLLGYMVSKRAEYGLSFTIGLTAFVLLPIFINAVRWLKDNLDALMRRVTGLDKGGSA